MRREERDKLRSAAAALAVLASLAAPALADEWPTESLADTAPKGMDMVAVKGGCYTMGDFAGDGDINERPAHEVCVKDFSIGKYLVTQAQWIGVMGTNPSTYVQCGPHCPVETVSYGDAQEFVRRLTLRTHQAYRLPTEAEWEYAARSGGKDEKWAGTNDEKALPDFAWFVNDSTFQTHPVGTKKPNAFGLYDMTGNVWEWVADWYAQDYYATSPKDNPAGPATGRLRVLRGGYWGDLERFTRVTKRIGLAPDVRAGGGYGFRVALTGQ